MGFYEPSQGSISVGGHNIRDHHQRVTRRWFKLVCQRTFLFNTSVLDNILFGTGGLKQEEDVTDLIDKLGLGDIFVSLPQGLHSMCGPLGNKLSGGQKQVVLILRSVLNLAPLLILDEPTSALDTVSRKLIMKLIKSLQKYKTIIIVTHDMELLDICTHTYKFNDGT